MSMTNEEAIKILTHYTSEYYTPQHREAHRMAIAALREKQERENPKPLTIEELRQMDQQPVYVVPANPTETAGCEWCVMWNDEACIPSYEAWAWPIKDYGKTWTAYRHKPVDATKPASMADEAKQHSGLIDED